jgi:hypothetical protein
MPNLVNRRRKKSKIIETQATIKSDSTDSDYEFSSKLNIKYNVLPEKIKSIHSHEKQEAFNNIRYERAIYFLRVCDFGEKEATKSHKQIVIISAPS